MDPILIVLISFIVTIALVFLAIDRYPTKPKTKTTDNKFHFMVSHACCIGDIYQYQVEADSHEEALKILVQWFYGTPLPETKVEQEGGGTISYPNLDRFNYKGMPGWFARCISGGIATEEDYKKLDNYCKLHGIKMRGR